MGVRTLGRPRLWDASEFYGDYLTTFGDQLLLGNRPSDRHLAEVLEVPLASTQRLRQANRGLIEWALGMGMRVYVNLPSNAVDLRGNEYDRRFRDACQRQEQIVNGAA